MSDPLYRREVLRLAADATGAGRLPHPCSTGRAYNPACGDRVTMDVALENGRISGVAHDTKACVLTQASAAILGSELLGLCRDEVATLREHVVQMLKGGDAPPAPFDVFGVFDGVVEHGNRHACVLLPLDAALSALDASDAGKPG